MRATVEKVYLVAFKKGGNGTKLFALVTLAVIIAAVVFAYDFTALHVEVRPRVAGTNATTPTVVGGGPRTASLTLPSTTTAT